MIAMALVPASLSNLEPDVGEAPGDALTSTTPIEFEDDKSRRVTMPDVF
jgi:hypothetical protein